jgi:HlyD family secretion protein
MSAITLPRPIAWGGRLGQRLGQVPRWILAAIAGLLIAAIILAMVLTHAASSTQITTQPVVAQTLVDSVTASGTVNPQNTIAVGTQVSGTISALYVDFNSKVKKGEVLAKIDPSTLQDQLAQATAQLSQSQSAAAAAAANANGASAGINVAGANSQAAAASAQAIRAAIASADANVGKAQAALVLAQQTLTRDSTLLSQGYIAQSTVDADRSNVAQSQSDVAAAQAADAQAKAQAAASASSAQSSAAQVAVTASQAQGSAATAQADQAAAAAQAAVVQEDQANLQHTIITSPVNGTVISRAVSVGQTVAASLQTPTLFTIAQDLTKMEVDISVGEPDIGNVRAGNTATFSVLAYPNQTFSGTVSQVRINPQTVNNVVTYTVIVDVINKDGRLLPGMTANATINVATANNALVVPLAAVQAQAARSGNTSSANGSGATAQSPWGAVNGTAASANVVAGANAIIMVQRGGKIVPVHVKVQLITASQAAVIPIAPDTLVVGDNVVTGSVARTHTGTTHAPGAGGPNPTRGLHV